MIHPVPKPPRREKSKRKHLPPSSSRPPRTRPKARNNARRNREFARCYHSRERVEFVKSLHCVAGPFGCAGEIQNAHTGSGGAGRKAAYTTVVPLCARHHAMLHEMGAESFQRGLICYFSEHAPAIERLWLAFSGGAAGEP